MSLEYGIIGNCRTAALISRNGSINWCCMPDFDSPSVFAKILDEGTGGTFAIQPIGTYKISQHCSVVIYNHRNLQTYRPDGTWLAANDGFNCSHIRKF